jgi:LPXTG-motif cell wall-anchored protein
VKTVRVPAAEGAKYTIQVVGQDGFSRVFSGVRDCASKQSAALKVGAAPGAEEAAALPVTGAALGAVLAGGVALVGAGIAALVLSRRRRRTA